VLLASAIAASKVGVADHLQQRAEQLFIRYAR
jgi:hypothetical protein